MKKKLTIAIGLALLSTGKIFKPEQENYKDDIEDKKVDKKNRKTKHPRGGFGKRYF